MAERDPEQHKLFVRTVAHLLMGLGGDTDADTTARIEAHGPISNDDVVGALTAIMRQEAFNHQELQALDGRLPNGQSVMAMAAHTGCNTVYGSTPPNNPHPYPWMNSLFQDGSTIGWLIGENFIMDHDRRSVIPERLATWLLEREDDILDQQRYYEFTHFSDNLMTDAEINEMPRVWIVGGDGGMGDIGYQNVSKMILQNRPNVKAVMLDTQVYSNTGGQNSDSTPMLGGGDMNAFGAASQGKCVEKKTVAETFLAGHGSPFVAQVSIANAPKLFRSILDALEYRGTAFLQCFTTCQPEHGVGDDMALDQAQRVRDSRGAPEFVFNPRLGETYQEGARSGAPCLRSRLRRLHQDAPGEGRQAGSDEDLAAVGPLLRGAPQGVAPAAEQGGDREHRVPCPAHTARGGGLGHAVEGGALRPRRGASRGTDPRPRRREDGLASVRGCAGQPPATRHRAGLP